MGLPGGRPHLGEPLAACLAREVVEVFADLAEVAVQELPNGYRQAIHAWLEHGSAGPTEPGTRASAFRAT
jgi:hypothetical protein